MTSENRVVFGPGVTMSTCDVKVIDDSEYEDEEEFEIALADTSENARIGNIATARVVIEGPNDASTVSLGNVTFTVSEDIGINMLWYTEIVWFLLINIYIRYESQC